MFWNQLSRKDRQHLTKLSLITFISKHSKVLSSTSKNWTSPMTSWLLLLSIASISNRESAFLSKFAITCEMMTSISYRTRNYRKDTNFLPEKGKMLHLFRGWTYLLSEEIQATDWKDLDRSRWGQCLPILILQSTSQYLDTHFFIWFLSRSTESKLTPILS